MLAGCASLGLAQSSMEREPNGFHLYSVAASLGYASGANDFLPVRVGIAESDLMGIISTSVGYSRSSQGTGLALVYTPSYVRTRQSLLRAISQNLSLNAHSRLGEKWRVFFSASALETSLDQLLLSPTGLGQVAGAPGTAQDLSGTLLGNDTGNGQLQSLVSGTSLTDSLSRGLVYGDRLLTASAHTGFSYNYSTRLSVSFILGAAHAQSRMDPDRAAATRREALIPRSSAGEGGVSIGYALSPRTRIGVEGSTVRVFAGLSDYYITRTTGSIGRQFTPHWFGNVHVGQGFITRLHQIQPYTSKPSLSLSSTAGYIYGSHTFLGAFSRMVGDLYGFGAASTDGVSGVWDWRKPRSHWGLNLSAGREQIRRTIQIVSWQAAAGLSCQTSRETMVTFVFGYLSSTGLPLTEQQTLSGWTGRMSFVWTPRGRWATVSR